MSAMARQGEVRWTERNSSGSVTAGGPLFYGVAEGWVPGMSQKARR
jgi:hypothetical protein